MFRRIVAIPRSPRPNILYLSAHGSRPYPSAAITRPDQALSSHACHDDLVPFQGVGEMPVSALG